MSFLDRFLAPDPSTLSAEDFTERVRPGDVVLDVRTPGEYAAGHLDGAVLMDLMDPGFRERAGALETDRTYYLYCQSGNRSGQATSMLRALGIEKAYNVGGIAALARAGAKVAR
jgi:rhodanese-related sulfurtransferase